MRGSLWLRLLHALWDLQNACRTRGCRPRRRAASVVRGVPAVAWASGASCCATGLLVQRECAKHPRGWWHWVQSYFSLACSCSDISVCPCRSAWSSTRTWSCPSATTRTQRRPAHARTWWTRSWPWTQRCLKSRSVLGAAGAPGTQTPCWKVTVSSRSLERRGEGHSPPLHTCCGRWLMWACWSRAQAAAQGHRPGLLRPDIQKRWCSAMQGVSFQCDSQRSQAPSGPAPQVILPAGVGEGRECV